MASSKPCKIQDILQCAREEALMLGHRYIGTKHILLGTLREGRASRFLIEHGIDLDRVRQAVRDLVPTHSSLKPDKGHLPITMRARLIANAAEKEARAIGQDSLGVEHLLLALLKDPHSASAKVLNPMGLTYEGLKRQITSPTMH